MIVEICVQSLEGAIMAQECGADRIELCSALEVGGLTPNMGLFIEVKRQINIPVHVLIRPRVGGFYYTPQEVQTMIQDVQLFTESGAEGIVIGALERDFTLDKKTMQQLITTAKSVNPKTHITAHRAFDWTPDPSAAAQILTELGCQTLLSSGQADNAVEGLELLKTLNQRFGAQLSIMPGSGINAQNREIFAQAGFKAIHASASTIISEKQPPTDVSFEESRKHGQRREINLKNLKDLLDPS